MPLMMIGRVTSNSISSSSAYSFRVLNPPPVAIRQRASDIQGLIPEPEKVKEDFAPNLLQDSLRNALRSSNFEVVEDAPIKAHIVLDEFSSGSTAKRMLVGFGAGRSTVSGRLVFQNADAKELANIPLKVRGNLLFSGYQGGDTQRRQAMNSFEQTLLEEISRLK